MPTTPIVRLVSVQQLETAVSNVFDAIRKVIVNRQQEILGTLPGCQQGRASEAQTPYLEDLPPECRVRLLELAEMAGQIAKRGYLEFGQLLDLMTLFRTKTEAPQGTEEAR